MTIGMLVLATAILSSLLALLLRGAASEWTRSGLPSRLATALLGLPYLAYRARAMRRLIPPATRPRGGLRLLIGLAGLWLTRGLIGLGFARQVRRVRGRGTHTNGIAARGRAVVPDEPTFPAHRFFRAGREFELVLRHATNFRHDDTCYDGRGAGFRLTTVDGTRERLDFLFNTGARPVFWDTWSFLAFSRAIGTDPLGTAASTMRRWLRGERARAGVDAAFLRAPSSFAHLSYYGQQTFRSEDADGTVRLVRYRLRGLASAPPGANDTSAADLAQPWHALRAPGESRAPSYLRDEYADRLARGPVRYALEVQIGPAVADATREDYDGGVPWGTQSRPWHLLAGIEVDAALAAGEEDLLRFNVGHAPASLGHFLPAGPGDPNSVLWQRASVYPGAQRARVGFDRSPDRVSMG